MKITIAQTRINEMTAQGYKLVGQTTGLFSFDTRSNLARKLESLNLTESEVTVMTGARAGQYANDGYQLLVFVKA